MNSELSLLLKFNVNINNEILVPVFINGNVANSKFEPDSRIESQLGDNIDLYLTLSTELSGFSVRIG